MSNNFINKCINKNGYFKYSFVVMLINNDIYANPCIVFAESVRKVGSICDLVVMIDDSISIETIDLLKMFYNKIIKINRIDIINKNHIQKSILTKLCSLKFTEYTKIFLVDVDTILFTNIDNIILTKNTNNKLFTIIENNSGFLLFEPSIKLYNKAIQLIKEFKETIEKQEKPLIFILKKLFEKIEVIDDIKISINKYQNNDVIQYTVDKPFLMSSSLTIEERMRLDHFKVWFSYFNNITNKYSEIKKYKCVQESIKISKYFLSTLSRFIINFIKINYNNKRKIVNNFFIIKNNKNLNYYHLDITRNYINDHINYDINNFDKLNFLKYLNSLEICKNKFEKNYEITHVKNIIKELDKNILLQTIFLNKYIKMFSNVFVIVEFKNFIENKELLSSYNPIIELKNNLIYFKKIKIEINIIKNILFMFLKNYTYYQRILLLNSISDTKMVTISIYETLDTLNLNDARINCNTFIFYEMDSKTTISSIFFNPNSLYYFEKNKLLDIVDINQNNNQKLINMIDRNTLIKLLYLQTLKKWIYNIYSSNEIENIIVYTYKKNFYKLVDNNVHNSTKIKKLLNLKLSFINIIFSKSSVYKRVLINENIDINKLYSVEHYWEFEGIKFLV